MLTLPQIMRKTPKTRVEASRYVKFRDVKKGYTEEGFGYIAAKTYSTKIYNPSLGLYIANQNPNTYITVILFLDRRLHVNVSCSCADFMYREEYALAQKDAADIEYSNGEPPDTTNPQQIPFICKHLVKLYTTIQPQLKRKR